jgi:chromosome segregation protein
MYLSDIEIVGFKSFAHKTNFKFTPGLSALVGPNGCGKTNIVDAVRWVLGEKKASVLRSDVMENVIFNGTDNRKPMGMAEVTLVIQNNKGILPSEYNEISITRRLYRSGESQYFMNKTQCRLKDILNLFMDTGLGSDSYSVIELKMVEAILSGRLDERRAMFEEAAGIKKYKLRRKESLRRLDQIQQDLDRVRDILDEVRKNVNSLSRQAAKTRRYNKLMDELKSLETKLLLQEYLLIDEEYREIENVLNDTEKKKNKSEIEINSKNKSSEDLKFKLKQAEHKYALAQKQEKSFRSRIAASNQLLAVSSERLSASGNNIARIENEINNNNENIHNLTSNINEATKNYERLTSELNHILDELDTKRTKRDELKTLVDELRENVNAGNEKVINFQSELNSLIALKKRYSDKKRNIDSKLQQSEEEKIKVSTLIDEESFNLSEQEEMLPTLEEEVNDLKNTLSESLEKKASIQSAIENQKNKLNELKNNYSGKKASLDFLNSLVHTDETSKFLLNSGKWRAGKETFLLGERIGTDDKYRVALVSALGEAANYIVADNREEAKEALALLKANNKGKATVIDLSSVNLSIPEMPKLNNQASGWLYDFIRADEKLLAVCHAVLGNTVVCENIEQAEVLIKDRNIDKAVTPDGEVLTNYGTLKGGSKSQNEAQWVGKKERIDKIKSEIKEIEENIEDAKIEINNLTEVISDIDINSIQNELKSKEQNYSQSEQKISRIKLKIESLENKLSLIEENSIRYNDELEELESDDSSNLSRTDELEHNLELAKEEYKSAKNELTNEEEKLKIAEKETRDTELNSVKLKSEINNLEISIKNTEKRIEEININNKSKKEEIEKIISEKSILTDKIEDLQTELETLEIKANESKNELDILAVEKETLNEEYDKAIQETENIRKEYDKLNNYYHQQDLLLNEKKIRLNNISGRLTENYDIKPDETDINKDEEFNIEESKTQVADIKEKLSAIGSINFMALEEYEEQNSRLEFYEKQLNDLEESEKTLKETIEEINAEAEKRFAQTFSEISKNFVELFKKLFGQDAFASLKLGEGNPLEADIEIIAKPPFKKPHSIEMLSGGEKTLTAISLLFAIYLVKPSPFCILDEVDAPLDDANIGKYVDMIKDFSDNTQFLIVTHNKKTMEAVDTLYGITMQENGVSKVVSVKFGDREVV